MYTSPSYNPVLPTYYSKVPISKPAWGGGFFPFFSSTSIFQNPLRTRCNRRKTSEAWKRCRCARGRKIIFLFVHLRHTYAGKRNKQWPTSAASSYGGCYKACIIQWDKVVFPGISRRRGALYCRGASFIPRVVSYRHLTFSIKYFLLIQSGVTPFRIGLINNWLQSMGLLMKFHNFSKYCKRFLLTQLQVKNGVPACLPSIDYYDIR